MCYRSDSGDTIRVAFIRPTLAVLVPYGWNEMQGVNLANLL